MYLVQLPFIRIAPPSSDTTLIIFMPCIIQFNIMVKLLHDYTDYIHAKMKLLIAALPPPPLQSVPSGVEQTDSDAAATGRLSFSSMCSELPSQLTAEMKRNISVPIAFVCLLHLANEKVFSMALDM